MTTSGKDNYCSCCQRILSKDPSIDTNDINELITLRNALSLAKIEYGARGVTIKNLCSLLKYKHIKLLELIRKAPRYFCFRTTTIKKKVIIYIADIYSDLSQNPETQEWLDLHKEKFKKTIELSLYDNYGYIHGYYIRPSPENDRKNEYLNTLEKIEEIKSMLNPEAAFYYLGGFGDSTPVRPENGWELTTEMIQKLKENGWEILNEVPLTK